MIKTFSISNIDSNGTWGMERELKGFRVIAMVRTEKYILVYCESKNTE